MRVIGPNLDAMRLIAKNAVDMFFAMNNPQRRVSFAEDLVTAQEAGKVLAGGTPSKGFQDEADARGISPAELANLVSQRLAEVWEFKNRRIRIKLQIDSAETQTAIIELLKQEDIPLPLPTASMEGR